MFKNNKGFTLIELMIVITMIVIVMALIVPIYKSMNDSQKSSQTIEVVDQNKEMENNGNKTTPVVNKNSSKGESNKL